MAKTIPLVDTSVFIEILRGDKKFRRFLYNLDVFYYSLVTRKELFQKINLRGSERDIIEGYLSRGKILLLDTSILEGVRVLNPLFVKKNIKDKNDIIIAATALVKKIPLVTLNKKHFSFIKELKIINL